PELLDLIPFRKESMPADIEQVALIVYGARNSPDNAIPSQYPVRDVRLRSFVGGGQTSRTGTDNDHTLVFGFARWHGRPSIRGLGCNSESNCGTPTLLTLRDLDQIRGSRRNGFDKPVEMSCFFVGLAFTYFGQVGAPI